MAEQWRTNTHKFVAAGMSTVTPTDMKPDTQKYAALINVRTREAGVIAPRPGLVDFNPGSSPGAAGQVSAIRKFTYDGDQLIVVHAGSSVGVMGEALSWNQIATGFTAGEAASIVLWRPEQQGQQWAYVYTLGKQIKFDKDARTSGDEEEIGIAPPSKAATGTYDITPGGAPTVAAGSASPGPTGTYRYAYRYHASLTGVRSAISALSAEITVTDTEIDLSGILASSDPQVDEVEIYRIGGTVFDLQFVAAISNGTTTYTDSATDTDISANPLLETESKQKPFVVVDSNGDSIGGRSLPYVWGPFDNRMLGCGAPEQPGTLFWTNRFDPDSMDPDNYYEVTGIQSPLLRGFIYDGRAFVFTNDGLYTIIPSVTGLDTFTVEKTSCSRGALSADAIAVGDLIYFVAEDGVFATRGGEEIEISDDIYNMFPHEGVTDEPPATIETMNLPQFREGSLDPDFMSLTYDKGYLRFSYKNTAGNTSMLVYDQGLKGWFYDDYLGKDITTTYGMEGERPVSGRNASAQEVLFGTNTGGIFKLAHGADDDGQAIQCGLVTFYDDFGDPRSANRFGDIELDFDPRDVAVTITPRLDDGNTVLSGTALPTAAGRQTKIVDLGAGHGKIAKNIAIAVAYSITGTDPNRRGPKIYEWTPSQVDKPEDTVKRAIEWHPIADSISEGYIYGVRLWIDTKGQNVTFQVWADNADTGITFTANSGTPDPADPLASEQKLDFTWTGNHFFGKMVKLVPTSNTNEIRITDWQWLFYEDPPLLDGIDTNWVKPLSGCDTAYVTGCRIEFDSENAAKTFIIQHKHASSGVATNETAREGNTKTHNGRDTAYFTFDEAVRADLVRVYTTDGVPLRFYGPVCWFAEPEPPRLANWNETFKDLGRPTMLKGVEFYVDTLGQDKTIEVRLDGAVHETITVNSNGRKEVSLAFTRDANGEYPRAVTAQLWPTDNNPAFLYRYRWIEEKEPEKIATFAPSWSEDGNTGAKFLQGARVLYDTQGRSKTAVIDYSKPDGTLGTSSPFTFSSVIRSTKVITLDPPVITHSMRLRGTDADEGFLYNVAWDWEPAPDLAPVWITQETSHGIHGWQHIRRGFLAVADCADDITIRFTFDGGSPVDVVVTAPGAGTYAKREFFVPANKFKAVQYKVFTASGADFRLFKNDSEIYGKQWGVREPYRVLRPFGDEHYRSGAVI